MSPGKKSEIWRYFTPIAPNYAKCNICEKVYSRIGRTTSGLWSHLKAVHAEEYGILVIVETTSTSNTLETPLKEAKKQLSIEESLTKQKQWDMKHPLSQKNDFRIGEMIALQDLPFNFVEGVGFQRLMQLVVPQYIIKGRNFFTDHICHELYEKVANKIRILMADLKYMSFTTDIWSEPSANVSLQVQMYKNKFFSDIVKDRVNTEIIEVALNLFNNDRVTSASCTKRSRASTYNNNKPSTSADWPECSSKRIFTNLAGILNSSSEGSDLESETEDTLSYEIKAQVKAFLKEKRADLEESSLNWWKAKPKYDKLAYLARKFLSVPPASVPSEQLFSGAGLIYEPLRNRLMGDKTAKLLFLKYNLPLLKFDY